LGHISAKARCGLLLYSYTDGLAWFVRRSVCHDREPCKNSWTDRVAVWDMGSSGSNEPCSRWRSRSPRERAILRGRLSTCTDV